MIFGKEAEPYIFVRSVRREDKKTKRRMIQK